MSATSPTVAPRYIADDQPTLLYKLWDLVTKPSDLIQEADKRQQARFVSAALAFIIGAVVLLILNAWRSPEGTTTSPAIFMLLVAVASAIYVLSRTKHAELAVILFVVTTAFNLFVVYFANPSNATTFYYLTVAVVFAGLLLSVRITAILIAAILVGLVITTTTVGRGNEDLSGIANFIGVFSGMVLVFVRLRNTLEATRRTQITNALQEVEALNTTLSHTNDELLRASALAKEAARLKSEFMATMSHELRTPLNAMLGFSGILLEGIAGEFDDETRHMIERIEQNSNRLLTLINDVLDIAKIEAGRLEIVSEPLSPVKLAGAWRSQMSVLAEQKHLAFTAEIDPTLPDQLYGDSERVSQVAINLLSNAFKFTESGSVKLALKSKEDSWLIEVTDTGIGIPPHALNYIFDEFRQLDGTSKRAYGGTGLGLAIVRNLCRMMDGTVSVTSKLGEGSVFTVKLPLRPVLSATPTLEANLQ